MRATLRDPANRSGKTISEIDDVIVVGSIAGLKPQGLVNLKTSVTVISGAVS